MVFISTNKEFIPNLEEVFHSDISSHSIRISFLEVEPDISGQ